MHHSSERYNHSTALRQGVAESFGMFVPYGLMAFAGIRPSLIETSRALNLMYQFWIHTEAIDTFNPVRIATHEYRDIIGDVADATNWRDRLGHVLRGPGWTSSPRRVIDVNIAA